MTGLLLVGHEKMPHGFGLRTRDDNDTDDGAGNCGSPASQARITGKDWKLAKPQTLFFPEIWYP